MDLEVQGRVQMPVVDLLGVTVALQETTLNTGSANPGSHSSPATLTGTAVATLLLGLLDAAPPTGAGVDANRLSDDESVFDQLMDVKTLRTHGGLNTCT